MKENSHKKTRRHSSKKAPKGGESSQILVNDQFAHIQAVQAQPLEVKVYNNNYDKALRAFRALVQKERILSVYKDKQTYEKPSDKRRRKRNEMKRKQQEASGQFVQAPKKGKKSFRRKSNSSD